MDITNIALADMDEYLTNNLKTNSVGQCTNSGGGGTTEGAAGVIVTMRIWDEYVNYIMA